jgi:hypothetical protein
MSVEDLIAVLKKCAKADAIVEAWDADMQMYVPVTGIVYDDRFVQIQTDDSQVGVALREAKP